MGTEKTKSENKPTSGRAREKSTAMRISALLDKFESQTDTEVKISVGDYLRLLQFHQEQKSEEPKGVEARWVDSLESPQSTEE
jgi:hypothetical protein